VISLKAEDANKSTVIISVAIPVTGRLSESLYIYVFFPEIVH